MLDRFIHLAFHVIAICQVVFDLIVHVQLGYFFVVLNRQIVAVDQIVCVGQTNLRFDVRWVALQRSLVVL